MLDRRVSTTPWNTHRSRSELAVRQAQRASKPHVMGPKIRWAGWIWVGGQPYVVQHMVITPQDVARVASQRHAVTDRDCSGREHIAVLRWWPRVAQVWKTD